MRNVPEQARWVLGLCTSLSSGSVTARRKASYSCTNLKERQVALKVLGEEPLSQGQRRCFKAARAGMILHQPERGLAAQEACSHSLLDRCRMPLQEGYSQS